MKFILEVSNLCYAYGKNKILDNLSFSLNSGEHLSLVGSNGCGKSTLLKCLCNFLNYEGSIKIDGIEIRNIAHKDLAKKITILPQKVNLYFDYKVFDVVKFGRYPYNKWRFVNKEEDLYINEILKNMGIYHLKDSYMSELSGGECQKVFIARVFAQNSDIILFDELSNNLDINSQIYIVQNISQWFRNKILISVFHDLNLVRNLHNKVMVIKNSKIYKYGDVDSIFKRKILKSIYGVDVKKFMVNSFEKWKDND